MYIPWDHPDVPDQSIPDLQAITSDDMHLDIRMLSRLLFDKLSGALTTAVEGMTAFPLTLPGGIQLPIVRVSLGGDDRAGEFRLHYLPQVQFNEQGSVTDGNNRPIRQEGMGFYFEGTIDLHEPLSGYIPLGKLRIIIPAFLIFEVPMTNIANFQVELQPIADLAQGLGANARGMDKIVVLANTPLGVQAETVADLVRNSVRDELIALANDDGAMGMFVTSTIAFSSGVNKYRKRPTSQIDFDVVLVPDNCNQHNNPMCFTYKGLLSSQVQPETNSSTRVSCFILGR
ncbi:hypothetical protein [Pleomorphovibrio marinus]|uniref:hypothetical protein n=1 Tax=Pleomorphovibrio marinus TaxID=2164132 RepID=UPI000E0B6EC1|nr:hypothetical protein [Pleomorphovibrio marinus]